MNNIATPEEMRQEAENRLEILTKMGLLKDVLKDFKKPVDGKYDRYYTENQPYGFGTLYWLGQGETDEGGTKIADLISDFEEEKNALVYHAAHQAFLFGGIDRMELIDLFYVSQYKDEWEDDKEQLKQGRAFVYALNRTWADGSEFGWIEFYCPAGGLARRVG